MSSSPIRNICLCLLAMLGICTGSSPCIGHISPGFMASQMDWANQGSGFLVSNNSAFALRFNGASFKPSSFALVVIHIDSSTTIWTANRGWLNSSSAKFIFSTSGDVYLEDNGSVAWSMNMTAKKPTAMVLQDSGNLVLMGGKDEILWQSFSHPTDTLLPGQVFTEGMRLTSFLKGNGPSTYLEIKSGDLVLYAGFRTPQTYWSIKKDRRTNMSVTGQVRSVSLVSNSWNFYDGNQALLGRFNFSDRPSPGDFWVAILGKDRKIAFKNLGQGSSVSSSITIPHYSREVPEYCNPHYLCYFGSLYQCPATLTSRRDCKPQIPSPCSNSNDPVEFLHVGDKLDYFALPFVAPSMKMNLNTCQEACRSNCSCSALFFQNNSGNCFLFDEIGQYRTPIPRSAGFALYLKILSESRSERAGTKWKEDILIIFIALATTAIVLGLICTGIRCYKTKKLTKNHSLESLEDEDFFGNLSVMPTRFTYADLCRITKNFSVKIGEGGFGSVYMGALPNGTLLAVKKLEGIGQGKKQFRVEVSTIGSIHHVHLVKLKGFCTEGHHRLLVYEYMPNGSLDRWIFKNTGIEGSPVLDWSTRFSIALGIAKGIAYLHDECDGKIVHCDIKPQNILLDDKFTPKVSDFGMAKLMDREDSLVYTTLRGTRGYLAPEWIKNNPISEKSDVYSYGMVLLEIIGGRKSYEPEECSKKAYLASYAVDMQEQGRAREIVDPRMEIDRNDDERIVVSIRVALWCIQEEMHLRPSMTKVVQMLEGLCNTPEPPTSVHLLSRAKLSGGYGSVIKTTDKCSTAFLSAVHLSGPR